MKTIKKVWKMREMQGIMMMETTRRVKMGKAWIKMEKVRMMERTKVTQWKKKKPKRETKT